MTGYSARFGMSERASGGEVPGQRVLYLAPDLDDAAVWRRAEMLRCGGAVVDIAGFRRGTGALPGAALVFGRTRNGRMMARALSVLQRRLAPHSDLARLPRPNAILARNLEMLALAVPLRRRLRRRGAGRLPLTYEVLDIHRLMVGDTRIARTLRGVERRLCRDVDHLIVSSPAFLSAHFDAHGQCSAPPLLVENKVLTGADSAPGWRVPRNASGRLRIGWNGVLRCRASLDLLDRLTRAAPGRYEVHLRGRPAVDAVPDFHPIVDANPDLIFGGRYDYPDDLPSIYGAVDLAWLVDRYDAGANSDWLLPNRLYESGLAGVPPIALAGTETARRLEALGTGLVLPDAEPETLIGTLGALTPGRVEALAATHRSIPTGTWRTGAAEARALVRRIVDRPPALKGAAGDLLVVIPTYNEAAHICGVLERLGPALRRRDVMGARTRVVVADGGSEDGTQDVVRQHIAAPNGIDLHLMHNPARVQSAGLNAAVAAHGAGMTWLLRLDAHARYPLDYLDTLLAEAAATGAASVVVPMRATGRTALQAAIAIAQNSRLGNGGSPHRTGGAGRFVAHGHHALMRLSAFRDVGGYDEGFTHNEDAELDIRLSAAGHRIWLTGRTALDYVPRARIGPLIRQYFRFGRGRARTLMKHPRRPALRQTALIGLAPACALAAMAPVVPVFGVPALGWAAACVGGGAALAVLDRDPRALASGPIAGAMHLAWSAGFWAQVWDRRSVPPASAPRFAPASPRRPSHVAVGVCTFRRSVLADTLHTLDRQDVPAGTAISIIVADNDVRPSARALVARFAAKSRHHVIYRHAPASNISVARNAVLEEAERAGAPTLAFIDDDELAPPHWLGALLARLGRGDAEAVVGPTRAIYAEGAPRWMTRLRVHDTLPELGADGRPIAGHSCNVIMDLTSPSLAGRRFDRARGVSGGEDTAFFHGAAQAGARFALAPIARLDEPVTPARARLDWLLKRRYRMGQTHGSLLREMGRARAVTLPIALAKVAYCGTLAVLTAPFAVPRNANLLRGALHAGTAASLIGLPSIRVYGRPEARP
ncbi:MAG: glycosyltransferase [Pseudomonadota bacterium]